MTRAALILSVSCLAACGPRHVDTPAPLIEAPSPVREPARERPTSLDGLTQGELALVVTLDGVDVWDGLEHRVPLDGCPPDGPTVCTRPGVDVRRTLQRTRTVDPADAQASERALDALMGVQDTRRLYNVLVEIKAADPSRESVYLAADPEIPYAFIVQLLDLTRAYRVNADLTGWFEDDAVFQEAALREDAPFFPHVAFVANE